MNSSCCSLVYLERWCSRRNSCSLFFEFSGSCCRALLKFMMKKLKAQFVSLYHFTDLLGCHKNPQLVSILEVASRKKKCHESTAESTRQLSSGMMPERDAQGAPTYTITLPSSIQKETSDPHASSSSNSSGSPTEFMNQGLILWNKTRQQWIAAEKQSQDRSTEEQILEPKLSWDATYESLLGTDKPFPQPVPLPEMVDFLVDIWEQDGLYD